MQQSEGFTYSTNHIRLIELYNSDYNGGGTDNLHKNFTVWFLLVLFYVSVIFVIVASTLKKTYVIVLISATCIVLAKILSVLKIDTLLNLEIIPAAFAFYILGYGVKLYRENHQPFALDKADVFLPLMIPGLVIISYWNTPIAMYNNDIGNALLFVIGAILGSYVVCRMAMVFQDNKFLLFMGKNSVIVYVLHFTVIKALHLIGKTIFPALSTCNYQYPANWHYFLIATLVLIPCILISNRYFYWMFGKKKVK